MKIKSLIILVFTQQLTLSGATQNFSRLKQQYNFANPDLSRNLERSLYGVNATTKISLNDISHKVNEIIKSRNLKLISQSDSQQTNHYLLETPQGQEMNLNIQKNRNGFKVNLNHRELSLNRSVQIGVQDYDLNQLGHFLHTQFQQINKEERRLAGTKPDEYDYEGWKNVIQESLKDQGVKLKDQDAVEGNLELGKSYEFEVLSQEDHELFSIRIGVDTVKNRERKILKIANNEKDHFRDNHSKYERRIVEADTHQEILDYLKETATAILTAVNHTNAETIDKIMEKVQSKKIQNLTFSQKIPHKVYDLEYNKKYIGYLNVYEIGDKYYGVSIKLEDRAFSTKLPKSSHNFNKAIEEFLKEFEVFMKGEDNSGSPLVTIEFKEAVSKLLDEIRNQCSNFDKEYTFESPKNLAYSTADLKDHVAKFVLEEIENCPFSKNELLIEQVSTGYFQYIHLTVNSNIMKTEYMIGLNNQSYQQRANDVITEIVNKVETIKKSQEEADDDVDLKFTEVQNLIETKGGDAINCSKKDKEEFFTCNYADTKSLFAVVKQTNSQILVNLMDNFRDSDQAKTTASNPSFSFQKRNGYDQMKTFEQDLVKFLEEQKARRLLKKELL